AQRIIDTGKVDRILDAAHHHRLLIVWPVGCAPLRQADTLLVTSRELGMKDDFGTPHCRPAHRLGIAPALMADHHTKLDPVDLEESPGITGHIELIFGWIELVLGLVSLQLAPRVNDPGDNLPACLREPFHPEDRRYGIRACPLRHGLECPFLLRLVKGPYGEILSPQPWEIGFWETHDLRALGRRIGQAPLDLVYALIKAGGDKGRRKGNDHRGPPMHMDSTWGRHPCARLESPYRILRCIGSRPHQPPRAPR